MFTIDGLIALCAAGISRLRIFGNVNNAAIGWMSEQWLMDLPASHPY